MGVGGRCDCAWQLSAVNATATLARRAHRDRYHLNLIAGLGALCGCILQKHNLAACGHQLDNLFPLPPIRMLLRIGIAIACPVLQTASTIRACRSRTGRLTELLLLLAAQTALLFIVIEKELEKLIARNEFTLSTGCGVGLRGRHGCWTCIDAAAAQHLWEKWRMKTF